MGNDYSTGIDIGGCAGTFALMFLAWCLLIMVVFVVPWARDVAHQETLQERARADRAWAQVSIEAERNTHRETVLAMVLATATAAQHDWQFMAIVAVLVGLLLWLLFDERRRRDGQG